MLLRNAFLVFSLLILSCHTTQPFEVKESKRYPLYDKGDLGMQYSPTQSQFKLWAPTASEVILRLYSSGEGGAATETVNLQKAEKGVWQTTLKGDFKGQFYTVQVRHADVWLAETADPWVKAVGVNGRRGQIVDLAATNPAGWEKDVRPSLASPNDVVLYEVQIRDFSTHASAGMRNKGQYLAFTERGTKSPDGHSTGIDHLADLGVTHVHLLPAFDFRSIDESLPRNQRPYNWGYDPEHYNAPEGSFASDPYDGSVRILEFKQMVQAMHKAGLRVVMDVVYNHTGGPNDQSVFNCIEPNYFYRQNANRTYSNASACGNETASERPMVRQFMLESMLYWAKEYHIDGFRVDLMGIHDIATMNKISAALHEIDPQFFIYGEGWTAGSSTLPDSLRALKVNTFKLDRIAAFSDDMRDGLKGSVFEHTDRGFVSNKPGLEETIQFGIVAATQHPDVDLTRINYSKTPWASEPYRCINYASCHDNHTLWDKLAISCPDDNTAMRMRMQKLAGAIVLTSQGVPFLHAGVEMCRTKKGVENSFESPDSINAIDWNRLTEFEAVNNYFKGLIALRKHHPAFRMTSAEMIRQHLSFLPVGGKSNFIAYRLHHNANGDAASSIIVLLNGSRENIDYQLPPGTWTVVADQYQVNEKGLRSMRGASVRVPGVSAMVLVEEGL